MSTLCEAERVGAELVSIPEVKLTGGSRSMPCILPPGREAGADSVSSGDSAVNHQKQTGRA